MAHIFRVQGVDLYIIGSCDVNSLIHLSGVNQEGRRILSNDEFFKTHYQNQYPKLAAHHNLFTALRIAHPSNCWKVMCKSLEFCSRGVLSKKVLPYDKDLRKVLCEELYAAFAIENAIRDITHIEECIKVIQDLDKHSKKKISVAFNRTLQCINACSNAQKTLIWGSMSDHYANGLNIEDAWTEKHFKTFLPQLKSSLQRALAACNEVLTRAEKTEDLI
jgi:hypothetical protein